MTAGERSARRAKVTRSPAAWRIPGFCPRGGDPLPRPLADVAGAVEVTPGIEEVDRLVRPGDVPDRLAEAVEPGRVHRSAEGDMGVEAPRRVEAGPVVDAPG